MKQQIRFKGHESFIIREGWLHKGLREVKRNPRVFFENYGADALGVGPNMAKSIRYWMKCSGLTEEGTRGAVRLTSFGEAILSRDPYFEDMFSLWAVHCNIARNREQATAWHLFFHEFLLEEFTREELEREMVKLASRASGGAGVSLRSVKDDCDAILRMYGKRREKDSNPEEKNTSPFGVMGLIKRSEDGYAKAQPNLQKLPAEIVLYLLPQVLEGKRGIGIEELLESAGGPGKILNLKRAGLMELLEQLERAGKVRIDQTAGLDMLYLPKAQTSETIWKEYYG